jgi:hypothetical protein
MPSYFRSDSSGADNGVGAFRFQFRSEFACLGHLNLFKYADAMQISISQTARLACANNSYFLRHIHRQYYYFIEKFSPGIDKHILAYSQDAWLEKNRLHCFKIRLVSRKVLKINAVQ